MKSLLTVCLIVSLTALGVGIYAIRSRNGVSSPALKVELGETRQRLRPAQATVAEFTSQPKAVQMAISTLKEKNSTPPAVNKVSQPVKLEDSDPLGHDAIVYDSNAKLLIAKDFAVSSPTGVMVSDLNRKMIVGDLKMETPTETIQANDAMVDVEHDTIVYGSDTKLPVAKDFTVSSPTGVMVSDLNRKMIVGDLEMETPTNKAQADGAVVKVDAGIITVTAESMTIKEKQPPNQLLRATEQAKSSGGAATDGER